MITSIVFFVEQVAFGLYILCAGGIVWMAYRLQQARRDLMIAQFRLEREHALARQASAITIGGLLLEALLSVWIVANLMAPTMRDIRLGGGEGSRAQERWETSTPGANAAPGLSMGDAMQAEGPGIFLTPPPTATDVGTIIPGAPEIVGCPRDRAWLLVPGNGQMLFEATTVWGTASITDFAFYRFEIMTMGPGQAFSPIGGDYPEPVQDGPLGEFLPGQFALGDYRFRLAVFDNTQTLRAVCEVTIHITEPPLTPTPLSAASPTPGAAQ